jgi:hypothetical protein
MTRQAYVTGHDGRASGPGAGMSLRWDHARATALGLPIIKGWRKRLRALLAENPLTVEQAEATCAKVSQLNGLSRLRRIEKVAAHAGCPFELHPESEIRGELYFRLREIGIDARLEVSVPSGFHRSGFMRIDIGVFAGKRLIHAIECKREGKKLGRDTRQASAYRALRERYGVEIHFVNSIDSFDRVLSACEPPEEDAA